jgi:hypothetical protein
MGGGDLGEDLMVSSSSEVELEPELLCCWSEEGRCFVSVSCALNHNLESIVGPFVTSHQVVFVVTER